MAYKKGRGMEVGEEGKVHRRHSEKAEPKNVRPHSKKFSEERTEKEQQN